MTIEPRAEQWADAIQRQTRRPAPAGTSVWVGLIEWDSGTEPAVALFTDPEHLLIWVCEQFADVAHTEGCDCGGEFTDPLPTRLVADTRGQAYIYERYLHELRCWHDAFHDAHTVPWATIPTEPAVIR